MHRFDTLFLDRDGVINKKLDGYVCDFESFKFMPDALNAISKLSKIFKRIFIVTNQQCIGKKILTPDKLSDIHNQMLSEIINHSGVITKIYYCPHLIIESCNCRKPKAGMIQQALLDFPEINIENSYLIGDSDSDIEAGNSMNLSTVKVDNKYTLASWTRSLSNINS
tara:strand:+ start:395 stop:895 length:501 start_codon:yes stop_codon:yes gene_type:complete